MLCLTNTGFVQCNSLGSHKVCCTTVFNFALFSNFLFCVLCLTNTGFVQCFPFGSRSLLDAFVVSNLCFACFTSQTPGLCSAIPSAPVVCCTLLVCCSCFVLFASSSSGLCSAFPFGSPRVYTLLFFFILWSLLLLCVLCPSSSGLCSDFFPGSFESARLFFALHYFVFCVLSLTNLNLVNLFGLFYFTLFAVVLFPRPL